MTPDMASEMKPDKPMNHFRSWLLWLEKFIFLSFIILFLVVNLQIYACASRLINTNEKKNTFSYIDTNHGVNIDARHGLNDAGHGVKMIFT